MNQMTTCYDCMLDAEMISTERDGALVNIAAVMFDIATETVGAEFSQRSHLATSVRDGGTMSASTVMWFMRQSDAVRDQVWNGGEDIRDVLRDLAIWLGQQAGRNEQGTPRARMWGNSARFDIGILESAYKRAQIPVPWYWSNERCFRTVHNLNPQVVYDIAEKGSGAHDPLVDCKFQIEHLFKIKRARRGQA
jgi:hypothetical protein